MTFAASTASQTRISRQCATSALVITCAEIDGAWDDNPETNPISGPEKSARRRTDSTKCVSNRDMISTLVVTSSSADERSALVGSGE